MIEHVSLMFRGRQFLPQCRCRSLECFVANLLHEQWFEFCPLMILVIGPNLTPISQEFFKWLLNLCIKVESPEHRITILPEHRHTRILYSKEFNSKTVKISFAQLIALFLHVHPVAFLLCISCSCFFMLCFASHGKDAFWMIVFICYYKLHLMALQCI